MSAPRSVTDVLRRALPPLERWLDEVGDGNRAEDFSAFVNLAERTLALSDEALAPNEKAFLRMWKGLCVATVELCNIERSHGRKPADVILTLPRVLACAAMYSTASVLKDGAPLRQVAKLLIEEFRYAAKEAADQIMAAQEREAPP